MNIYENLEVVAAASGFSFEQILESEFAAGMELECKCRSRGEIALLSLYGVREFRMRAEARSHG